MEYNHGPRVDEKPTSMPAPQKGSTAVPVVIGTAPVHFLRNWSDVVNKPVLIDDYENAVEKLGYSDEWDKYTLCMSMYSHFVDYGIAPVVFINVLDPSKHAGEEKTEKWDCSKNKDHIFESSDTILNSVKVSKDGTELAENVDYLKIADDGHVVVMLLSGSTYYTESELTLSWKEVVTDKDVLKEDVIGGYSVLTGRNTGLSCVNDVFPDLQKTPEIISAPGFSHYQEVAAALQAASVNINGEFNGSAIIDIDCSENGATKCEDFKAQKEKQCVVSENAISLWPKLTYEGRTYYYSAMYSAAVAHMDSKNGNIPNLSPSNITLLADSTVLEDGTEIRIDKRNANNYINAYGGVSAINYGGWRIWGNNTSLYPNTTDPKDRWICVRRFFNYYKNRLLIAVFGKADKPITLTFIEAICDDENIWFNAMKGNLHIAGGKVTYDPDENPLEEILNGHIVFHVKLACYIPAEDIKFIVEFDPTILRKAFGFEGGE